MSTRPIFTRPSFGRAILAATIAPAFFAASASAADVNWEGVVTLNSQPVYGEGLREGKLPGNIDETSPNPGDGPDFGDGVGVSLSLRMANDSTNFSQGQTDNAEDFWADNRTWVYTGEINAGPEGKLSFAENIDDFVRIRVDGALVLTDNAWNVVVSSGVLNFEPNSWHTVDIRMSNGGGGAGPVTGNGFQGGADGYGMGISHTGAASTNGADYFKPIETADGTPQLFRYLISPGAGGDDVTVTGDAIVTLGGDPTSPVVTENSLNFNPTFGAAVLTVNNGDAVQRTLAATNTILGGSDGVAMSVNGSAHLQLNNLNDNGKTGLILSKDGGSGDLILTGTPQGAGALDGVTLRVTDGRMVVLGGGGAGPLDGLTSAIQLNGTGARLRFGSTAVNQSTTFPNSVTLSTSATIEHTSGSKDTLSGPDGVSIGAANTLTADIAGGSLAVRGPVSGNALTKIGAGAFNLNGATNLTNVTVNGGRLEISGPATLANAPVLQTGTLALRNADAATPNAIPGPLTVGPGATLEGVPNAFGAAANALNLTGGTLDLSALTGLNGFFYSGDDAGANREFNSFETYDAYLDGRVPTVTALTSSGGVTELNYPNGDYATFGAYGLPDINNFVSRMSGKIFIPTTGDYTFGTTSDDGSVIFIDQESVPVVNNNFYQGPTRRTGTINLSAGYHDIDIGFYEGGVTQALIVDWAGPGFGPITLSNAALSPTGEDPVFGNPINVQQNSTINVSAPRATASTITISPTGVADQARTLTTTGGELTVTDTVLSGAGTYGLNVGGIYIAKKITDSGADVDIVKDGPGILVLDNTETAQLQNAGSSITVNAGSVGLLLGGALQPQGNANIAFNGGGIVLSSKVSLPATQNFTIPNFTGNGLIEARQIGSGVAGPITINLTGNLNVAAGQTLTLGTADAYTLSVGGTATGTGTLRISGGNVVATTDGAVQGLSINMTAPPQNPATLQLQTNTPVIGSLSGTANSTISVGTGAGAATFTVNQTSAGRFAGTIAPTTGSTMRLVKSGTGALTLAGTTTTTGISVLDGILEFVRSIPDGNVVTVGDAAGGTNPTLQFASEGLFGEFFNGNDGGASANFGTPATYQAYFNSRQSEARVTSLTSTNGVTEISFNPDGSDAQMYAQVTNDQYTSINNIVSRMSGRIFVPTDGVYTFGTTSDDGSMLFIDGATVVSNNFYQGMTRREGSVTLTAGYHDIDIGFYEGGGGNGLIVDWAGPGFGRQTLPNSVLETPRLFSSGGGINLVSSGTFDLRNGSVSLGPLTWATGTTLTATAGSVAFSGTTLTAGTYSVAGAGDVVLGNITDGGAQITFNKAGTGGLIVNGTNAQLTNAANVFNVSEGHVVAVSGAAPATNPLGASSVNLTGGGLRLSSTGGEAIFNNTVNVSANSTIAAGNFGGGAVSGAAARLGSPLSIAPDRTLAIQSTSDYTFTLGQAVSGTGTLQMTGGTVTAEGAVNVGTLDVDAGTLSTVAGLTAPVITVDGGTLRTLGAVSSTGGATVGRNATIEFNGNTYSGGLIAVNGGTVRAGQGVVNLADRLSFAPVTTTNTPNALRARFLGTGGEFVPSLFPGNSDAGILGAERQPAVEANLSQPLSFLPYQAADPAFSAFFGGVNAGQRFTAGFFGKFTAPTTGEYLFQVARVDDLAGFWVDLDHNGIFEQNGAGGSELMSGSGCCGDGPLGAANLIGGESYRVAIAVEDTGGGSSIEALFQRPGDAAPLIVNPGDPTSQGAGGQLDFWSYDSRTGGGRVESLPGAELQVTTLGNARDVLVDGTLRLNSATPSSSTVGVLRTALGGTLTLDAGNTLLVDQSFSIAPNMTFVKNGAGTLTTSIQAFGTTSTFQVDAGVVNLDGPVGASIAGGGGGAVTINTGAVVNVNGGINGSVAVNTGGTLAGAGTVADVVANTGGIVSPAGPNPGQLSATNVTFAEAAQFDLQLNSATLFDSLRATGDVTLNGTVPVNISLGYDPEDTQAFTIVSNKGLNFIQGPGRLSYNGNVLDENEVFSVTSGAFTQPFQITYFGDNSRSIVLMAVPEPTTWATLLSGVGMLVGLQRFRRRNSA